MSQDCQDVEQEQKEMEKYSEPIEKQERQIQKLKSKDLSITPGKMLLLLAGYLSFYAIISLIIATATRKNVNKMNVEYT